MTSHLNSEKKKSTGGNNGHGHGTNNSHIAVGVDTCVYPLPGAEGCRDIKFSKLYPQLFASVYENGILAIWNTTNSNFSAGNTAANSSAGSAVTTEVANKCILKVQAHPECVMCVDWHPTSATMIATASRDKQIKVWDVSGIYHIGSGTSSSGISSSQGVITAAISSTVVNPKPLYRIYTNTSVNKIQWRCFDKGVFFEKKVNVASNKVSGGGAESPFKIPSDNLGNASPSTVLSDINMHKFHIASCSTSATTANGGIGMSSISLWDVTSPHVPMIVLKGAGVVAGGNKDKRSSSNGSHHLTSDTNTDASSAVLVSFNWLDTPDLAATYDNSGAIHAGTNRFGHVSNSNLSALQKLSERRMLNLFQHIIAISKEGKIIVYDIR